MKKQVIKRQIIIPTASMVLFCGLVVLLAALLLYRGRINDFNYDIVRAGISNAEQSIQEAKNRFLTNAPDIAAKTDIKDAVISGDKDLLTACTENILADYNADYMLITDSAGNVLLRVHDKSDYGDNVAHRGQIQKALSGEVNSAVISRDKESMRITACAPVYDDNGGIAGTITIGNMLTSRLFTANLKNATGCDFTIFDGSSVASSTLNFPSLSYLSQGSDVTQEELVQRVVDNAEPFEGMLLFLRSDYLSVVNPIYNDNNEAAGMIFAGVLVSRSMSGTVVLVLVCAGLALAMFILSLIASNYNAKSIIKKFEEIEDHMLNRDRLFEAVNRASIILLEIDETDDIRTPLISCMEHIGLALKVDRVHLWRGQMEENTANQFVREYSWVSEYGKRKAKTPKYITSTTDDTQLDWMDKFLKNEHISGIVSDMEEELQMLIKPIDAKAIAMIPLFLEEQFWGMFTVDTIQDDRNFTDDEINILHSISLMMANIVRRHDLQNENLKVYFDALTGINNRRYFDKTMARTLSSLSRSGGDLGVMMIDVDYFKKYNDTYGHAAGDECLIRIAEILAQSATRVDDFVARYGGEEFVVVMPNTDKEGAIAVANRMLENIRAAKIPHKASDVNEFVTVSIGITTGRVKQNHLSEDFVQKADDMLYKSKHGGRNRYTYGDLEQIGGTQV